MTQSVNYSSQIPTIKDGSGNTSLPVAVPNGSPISNSNNLLEFSSQIPTIIDANGNVAVPIKGI